MGAAQVVEVAALEPLLETRGLNKFFGGLHAVRDVDLSLSKGEIRAVIGPNGAGKTTLVSLFSGRLPASSGSIMFRGRDVTRLPAYARVRRGIVYTFQVTSVFKNFTCYENVALAAQRSRSRDRGAVAMGESLIADRVRQALEEVGLGGMELQLAGNLPYGHQRLLEVAMGLSLGPELLILDEPTQGLAEGEIRGLCRLIRSIAHETTILLIEHNMPVVLDMADRITVMNHGSVLAEGTPNEIESNPLVQETYLGT